MLKINLLKRLTGRGKTILPGYGGYKNARLYQKNLARCQSCGQCLTVCPVVRATGSEIFGPRAKIALLSRWLAGHISTNEMLPLLSSCLHCGKCEAICTAELPLKELFQLPDKKSDRALNSLRHKGLYCLQYYPVLASLAQRLSALASHMGVKGKFLSRSLPSRSFKAILPPKKTQDTTAQNILLFPGCLARYADPAIADASADLIRNFKYSVLAPALPCCGRITRVRGHWREYRKLVQKNLSLISALDFNKIFIPCSACLEEIKKHWPLLASLTIAQKEQAKELADKCMGPEEFLEMTGSHPIRATEKVNRTFFHFSCLSSHSCRKLTRKIFPKARFPGREQANLCCGATLSDSLPSPSNKNLGDIIGKNLRDQIIAQNPELILTNCHACKLQLEKIMDRQGDNIPVRHVVELYSSLLTSEKGTTCQETNPEELP